MLPSTCPNAHSCSMICCSASTGSKGEGLGGSWGVSSLSSSLIMRDDVSVSSARLPCVIGGEVLWSGGGARGGDRGKNREIKEHNNTFLIIYHVPLCHGSSRGPKQNNNKSGWWGVGWGDHNTMHSLFVFATPARSLPRPVRSGVKIKKETGLSISRNRFFILHLAENCRKRNQYESGWK